MSNSNRDSTEEPFAKWRQDARIAFDRWLAKVDEELEDPEKGPILREQLIRFVQGGSEITANEDVSGRQSAEIKDVQRQRTQRWMHVRRKVKVTITLPKYFLQAIDGLAETVEKTRSDVIEAFAEYCLDHEHILDGLFPSEKQEETEKEEARV